MADMDIISIVMSAVFSAISIISAWRSYQLARRANILRPHSDLLRKSLIEPWINEGKFLPKITDIANLPLEPEGIMGLEYYSLPPLEETEKPMYWPIYQHLKTGYHDLFSKMRSLKEKIKRHHDDVGNLVEKLVKRAKDRIGLPDRLEVEDFQQKHACYYRLVVFILSSILTGKPSESELRYEKWYNYSCLRWSGDLIMVGEQGDLKACHDLIKEALRDQEIKSKADELKREGDILRRKRDEIKQMLRIELIEKIRLGGVIKGRCWICDG